MKNSILLSFSVLLFIGKAVGQEAPADVKIDVVVDLELEEELSAAAAQASGETPEPGTPPVPTPPLKLVFPDQPAWNLLREGQELAFRLKASGGKDSTFTYALRQGRVEGMDFDSLGYFSWTPGYDFVNRLSPDTTIQLLFEARNEVGERINQVAEFVVEHVNRPPDVGELKPFYVRYNALNTYEIESSVVKDEDGDPVVIVPVMDAMPEGASLTEQGQFSWNPSLTQFNELRDQPILLEFYVEDQPAKDRAKGHFMIKATQQDLPPSIQMIPSQKHFRYKENATINLRFQLYDPNGEEDISSFSLLAENTRVPAGALVQNTPTQYEFIWRPTYDFVKDPLDSLSFDITFFVIDKSHKQEERKVSFTILNAVNEAERDLKLYNEYRSSLLRAWDLMEQLKEAEKKLKKKYKRAKRGKKVRSLTNASLGAATGIGPVVIEEPATSKKVTAIGGTVVMTIGTLEATEVFGRSAKDLVERLNDIIEKRNELQTKGDIFARKYALKSSRRSTTFMKDVDDFVTVMNLKGLVALELDAGWKNKSKPTDKNIGKTFNDFSPDK